jgi:sterol desaturase/sphingolipid hydroxylase (fatty acid hydroxylase superfamily)
MPTLLGLPEAAWRLTAFLFVLLVMACLERISPRRQCPPRLGRWFANLSLVAIGTGGLRLLVPIAAVGVALICEGAGFGLLNLLDARWYVAWPASLLALDLALYVQHVLTHRIDVLWRLHRMHHSDLAVDVSTGVRFHPVEILLSMLWKMAVVAVLGAPAAAVVVFEVLLNAAALFNHANLHVPGRVERWLRLVVVTPDMHRVHHSIVRSETDSNFGFSVPWWDRAFGTYRAEPAAGHEAMTIGLERFREKGDQRLDRLLLQPLE